MLYPHFITPPSCNFSYAEGRTGHDDHRVIFRRTGPDQFDMSPFPDDEDFVFDPSQAEPEHPALAWERLAVLYTRRRRT